MPPSHPTVERVFIDGRKPGAFGIIFQMADAKVLFMLMVVARIKPLLVSTEACSLRL